MENTLKHPHIFTLTSTFYEKILLNIERFKGKLFNKENNTKKKKKAK